MRLNKVINCSFSLSIQRNLYFGLQIRVLLLSSQNVPFHVAIVIWSGNLQYEQNFCALERWSVGWMLCRDVASSCLQ